MVVGNSLGSAFGFWRWGDDLKWGNCEISFLFGDWREGERESQILQTFKRAPKPMGIVFFFGLILVFNFFGKK